MKKLLYIFATCLCFSGCTTSKIITSSQNAFNSRSILLLPSMTGIEILTTRKEKLNEAELGFLNQDVGNNVREISSSFFMRNRIKFVRPDVKETSKYAPIFEIWDYYGKFTKSKSGNPMTYSSWNLKKVFKSIKVSDSLSTYIKSHKQRFALSIVTVGYTRSYKNNQYRKIDNVAKTFIFGAGAYSPSSGGWTAKSESYTANYLVLIDAERKELAMFQKKDGDFEATNKEKLQGQLNGAFEDFWINYRYK
jgi:hypothetical protein